MFRRRTPTTRTQRSLGVALSLSVALSICVSACSEDPALAKKPDVLADAKITTDTSPVADAAADSYAVLPAPATSSVTLQSGEGSLEANLDRGDLVLRHKGVWRTRIELKRLRIGRVGRFDVDANYNPGEFVDSLLTKDTQLPDKFEWLTVTSAEFAPHDTTPPTSLPDSVPAQPCAAGEGATLLLTTVAAIGEAGPQLELVVRAMNCALDSSKSAGGAAGGQLDGVFQADLHLADPVERARAAAADQSKDDAKIDMPIWIDIAVTTGRQEQLYGLGEYFDTPEHRGKVRPMQIQTALGNESGYNEAHVPVPLLVGTVGWGIFIENRHPAVFDCGVRDPDRVHARFNNVDLRVWLFAAPHALDVVGRYTRVTGPPVMPARWAFGGLIWRNENKSSEEVLDDMAQIRKAGLSVSGMWIDRPYDTHVNNFDFDPARFEDIDGVIAKVQALGMRVALWSTPYVEDGGKYRAEFVKNGWMVKVPPIAKQFLKWGGPVDLTHPEAAKKWAGLCNGLRKRGIEGWKLDFGEDTHVGLFNVRAHYAFANGQNERTMHHAFSLYYHQPYFETLPGADAGKHLSGGFIIARAGTYGGQTKAAVIWPGDLDATMGEHDVCVGGTCHVAGLPGALAAMQSLAASGYPLFGSDTGGYRHKRADKATFMRWLSHTALSPILQLGGSKQHNPWDFTKYPGSEFDKEVLAAAQYWTQLHARLFPYIYTLALRANAHGRGPIRPFGMTHPELAQHLPVAEDFKAEAATQYWLGDALLVAPIMDESGRRKVVLPAVPLRSWWTKETVSAATLSGAATPTVVEPKLPLHQIPLYVREGSIIPLLRPGVDTLAPATDKTVDSFANKTGRLHAMYVPGAKEETDVYDGTKLGAGAAGKAINLAVTPGDEFTHGVEWEIWSAVKVKAVAVGKTPAAMTTASKAGQCVGCWWREGAVVHVRMPPGVQTGLVLFDKSVR